MLVRGRRASTIHSLLIEDVPDAGPPRQADVTEDAARAQVTELFERLRLPVYRYLVVVLGRTGEAEELTQEAFIRLYDYLRAGHAPNEARFWLFRVAQNLALNVLRRRRYIAPLDSHVWDNICRQVATGPDPERRVLRQEQYGRLVRALERLTPRERQCLALRSEGIRYREIADLLSITYAAVVDAVRRAVGKLARALHD